MIRAWRSAKQAQERRPIWGRLLALFILVGVVGGVIFIATRPPEEEPVPIFDPQPAVGPITRTVGEVAWEVPTQGVANLLLAGASNPDVFAEDLYIATDGGALISLDGRSGNERWRSELPFGDAGAVALGDGRIFVGSGPALVGYNVSDGSVASEIELAEDQVFPVIGPGGELYATFHDGSLFGLSQSGSGVRWSVSLGSHIDAPPVVGPDGTIYVGTMEPGNVSALGPEGNLIWTAETGPVEVSPALGSVYVATADSTLFAFDEEGFFLWERGIDSPALAPPTVSSDGTVYVLSDSGLFGFTPDGDQVLEWINFDVSREHASLTVDTDGTAYVLTYDGVVWAVQRDGTASEFFYDPDAQMIAAGPEGLLYVAGYSGITALRPVVAEEERISPTPTPEPLPEIELELGRPEVRGFNVFINGFVGVDGGEITRLSWDWGDGSSSDAFFTAEHTYNTPGLYRVTATAFDNFGRSKNITTIVIVEPLPVPTATSFPPTPFPEFLYGGVLRLALDRDPFSGGVDPYQRISGIGTLVNSLIFSGLFRIDPVTPAIEGDLVEAWDMSANGTTWTLRLRRDARFHDGTPVTATDVHASLKAMLSSGSALLQGLRDNIAGLDIIDDFTVRITLRTPFAPFLRSLASRRVPILPERLIAQAPLERPEQLIGSGPFQLAEHVPQERLLLKRNDSYFLQRGTLPYLDGVELYVIPDFDTRLAAFRAGRIDFFGFPQTQGLSLSQARDSFGDGTAVLYDGPPRVVALWFDTQTPPFNDLRVRWAVANALDRQRVTEFLYGEQGLPQSPVPSLYFPDWAQPQAAVEGVLPYDPERAKRLLVAAGYPDDFFTVIFVNGANVPAAEVTAAYLAEVGIEVEIALMSSAAEFCARLQEGEGYGGIYVQNLSRGAGDVDASLFFSFSPDSIFNYSRVSDPRLEEMLFAQRQALDPDSRKSIINVIDRYVAEQAYIVPMPGVRLVQAHGNAVRNFSYHPNADLGALLEQVWLDRGNARPAPTPVLATPTPAPGPFSTPVPIRPSPTPLPTPTSGVAQVSVSGIRFAAGAIDGSRITVDLGSVVVVYLTLNSSAPTQGELEVTVVKDLIFEEDQPKKLCVSEVALGAGVQEVQACDFFADDMTIGTLRQYFVRIAWNGEIIYDNFDPNTRPFVLTREVTATPTAAPTPAPLPTLGPTPLNTEAGSVAGIHWGTGFAASSNLFDFGTWPHYYSSRTTTTGYLYSNQGSPTVLFAKITPPDPCIPDRLSYQGVTASELTDLGALQYEVQQGIAFFTTEDPACYPGTLAFRQGDQYGLIQPIEVNPDGFFFNWWYGDSGVIDFSQAFPS